MTSAQLLTPQEVADRLSMSTKTVQRLTRSGELEAVYPRRFPRYTERAVAAYIASLEQPRGRARRRRRVA